MVEADHPAEWFLEDSMLLAQLLDHRLLVLVEGRGGIFLQRTENPEYTGALES